MIPPCGGSPQGRIILYPASLSYIAVITPMQIDPLAAGGLGYID